MSDFLRSAMREAVGVILWRALPGCKVKEAEEISHRLPRPAVLPLRADAWASGPCGIPRNRGPRKACRLQRWRRQALAAARGASFPHLAARRPATRRWP